MQLYRAVSAAEMADLLQSGKVQTTRGSLEGKWFAESETDAARCGQILYGLTRHFIIMVTIAPSKASELFRLEMLDNIGPARFADIDELHYLTFAGAVS